jgi:DNA-binding CsgD family transcriptional regulator/tetratricopeptide (TPR) repeat protein
VAEERPFIGRATELSGAQLVVSDACAAGPRAIFVVGPAGIGKTRLADEISGFAMSVGYCVLSASCYELTAGALPWQPLLDLLELARGHDALSAAAEDALEEFRDADADPGIEGAAGRAGRLDTVRRTFAAFASAMPVLLKVEDLQWADASTLDALTHVLRSPRTFPLVVLGTARARPRTSDAVDRFLAQARRHPSTAIIDLTVLSRAETGLLLAALLGTTGQPNEVDQVVTQTGGNPFLIDLLARSSLTWNSVIPDAVRLRVADVLVGVDDATLTMLEMAAVVGRDVPDNVLATVTQIPPAELIEQLLLGLEQGLLVPTSDGVRFSHDLVRESLLDRLIPLQRRQIHERTARALELLGPGLGWPDTRLDAELAEHYLAADVPEGALASSMRAARGCAVQRAYPEACLHYRRVVHLWPRVEGPSRLTNCDRTDLLLALADASLGSGQPAEAIEFIDQALADETGDPLRRGALLQRRARYAWADGHDAASLASLAEADELLAPLPPSAEHARVLAARSVSEMLLGQHADSLPRAELAVTMARELGLTAEEAYALTARGVDRAFLGDPDGAIRDLSLSLELAGRIDDIEALTRAYINLSFVLDSLSRFTEAIAIAVEGIERLRRLGAPTVSMSLLINNLASFHFSLGSWREAEQCLETALGAGPPAGHAAVLRLLAAEISVGRGNLPAAQTTLDELAPKLAELREPQVVAQSYVIQAELYLWERRPEDALSVATSGLTWLKGRTGGRIAIRLIALSLRAVADLAEGRGSRRTAEGDAERVTDLLSTLAELTAGSTVLANPECGCTIDLAHAEASRLARDHVPAVWERVKLGWARLGVRYPEGYAALREAEVLLECGNRARAAIVLAQANQVATELGAGGLGREVAALARRSRLELAMDARSPKVTVAATHGLTAREMEVLALLAEGSTNRQIGRALFISEKTASVHVSNVLAKLMVRNRSEAAVVAHRTGLLAAES